MASLVFPCTSSRLPQNKKLRVIFKHTYWCYQATTNGTLSDGKANGKWKWNSNLRFMLVAARIISFWYLWGKRKKLKIFFMTKSLGDNSHDVSPSGTHSTFSGFVCFPNFRKISPPGKLFLFSFPIFSRPMIAVTFRLCRCRCNHMLKLPFRYTLSFVSLTSEATREQPGKEYLHVKYPSTYTKISISILRISITYAFIYIFIFFILPPTSGWKKAFDVFICEERFLMVFL